MPSIRCGNRNVQKRSRMKRQNRKGTHRNYQNDISELFQYEERKLYLHKQKNKTLYVEVSRLWRIRDFIFSTSKKLACYLGILGLYYLWHGGNEIQVWLYLTPNPLQGDKWMFHRQWVYIAEEESWVGIPNLLPSKPSKHRLRGDIIVTILDSKQTCPVRQSETLFL